MNIEKTKYELEQTKEYIKIKRTDEYDDGSQTNSSVLQTKNEIVINP